MSDKDNVIRERFISFMNTQYGADNVKTMPSRQLLEIEDTFYAGASAGFYNGFAADDDEAMSIDRELRNFGANIVKRYKDAGLDV